MTASIENIAAQPAEQKTMRKRAREAGRIQVCVTPELLIYVALAILALALRVAQLDRAPLGDAEARQALAALRTANSQTPGDTIAADSPLTFTIHTLTFALLPAGSEIAARLPVALGGVLLALAPALWRRYLNPLPPLFMSAMLAISPVALLASRTTSPVIWTMLLAITAPWLVVRAIETRRPGWAVTATAAGAAMVFLAEPAGFLTLLALAFGVAFAWLTDDPDGEALPTIRALWREWPWTNGAIAAGLVLVVVGTAMFWIPSGLTVIGNALWSGVEGFATRQPDAPVAFPVWVGLRYEWGLVIFGLFAIYRAIREGGFFERALVGWALGGIFWSVGYAGAGAAHALWFLVPLGALVALMVTNWLTERPSMYWKVPAWGVPAHVLITLALWLAVGLSFVLLGKWILYDLPGGVTSLDALLRALTKGLYTDSAHWETQQVQSIEVQPGVLAFDYVLGHIQQHFLFVVLLSLFNGVIFFLAGGIWGPRTAGRGFGLGTLAFALLIGLGLGERAALDISPGDPREYWDPSPVTRDVFELRATLEEMSLRDTGEPRLMAITAMIPDDGALAWALRDYPNAVFVDGVGPEVTSAAVVIPALAVQPPMGADYIGKDLITRRSWSVDWLWWRDTLMWFYRGDSQIKPVPSERIMLWIRKDVYGVQYLTEQ